MGLPYDSKGLQRFEMEVQRLVFQHPHTLEMPAKDMVTSLVKVNYQTSISEAGEVKINPAYGP